MRKILLSFLFCLLLNATNAQIKWPAITQQTKPWARWWWQGSAVDKKNLTHNMQDYKAAGLGGLEVTPIYGVYGYEKQFIDFLSPQWMQMLDHTLAEGKRLGLGIDIANGTGWPFGGPTITDKEASKTVVFKTFTLSGGEELKEKVIYNQEGFVRGASPKTPKLEDIKPVIAQNNNLQELAIDQVKFAGPLPLQLLMAYSDADVYVDLTSKVDATGKLNWKAPDGKWTLHALFLGLHGKMVERAAPGGEGYAIDHFSSAALQHYFKRFDEAFKGHDISSIRALFNDSYEVDDARGQSNWTENFVSEFQKRRGYDLKRYIPALMGKADAETNSRIIFDYRTTIGDLILEDFTQEWKKWGTKKGAIIRNQSHGSPANLLDLYGAIDIPETEGDDIMRYKFATSVSHVMGKPLASSESATWLNEHFLSSWGDVKKALDLFLLGGVNHIFYHGVNYSPKEEQWPGWLFYAAVHFQQTNPQWKDFHTLNEYVARAQSFLQAGKPDNDILVYYPLDDRYSDPGTTLLQHFDGMGKEFAGTDFQKTADWMQDHGYSFDFFSDRQLQNFTSSGKSIVTGGSAYQTIFLPANKYISEKAFLKIVNLAKAGATVLVYKNLPEDVPGFAKLAERRSAYQALIKQLNFTKTGKVNKAKIGNGSFIVSDNMEDLLQAGGLRNETMHDKGLQFIRRKNADGYTYFINNRTEKPIDKWIILNRRAVSAAMFDPMFGKSGIAEYRTLNSNGLIEVKVQLQPSESIIVQAYSTKKSGARYPYIETQGKAEKLRGDWTVKFIDGGPSLPATYTTKNLSSWTDQDGAAYQAFSGVASYTINFEKPKGFAVAYKLNLGKVHETAEVFLNGKSIATLIGPMFEISIPSKDLLERNMLEIKVASLMANRISYMDKNNINWQKFYNINMSARKRENVKNGIFNAANWQPLPSGLLGPVTLSPITYAK